jgi:PAS domain S-box-containing protein
MNMNATDVRTTEPLPRQRSRWLRRIELRYYGLAVISVLIAVCAALFLESLHFQDAAVPLLLFAVGITSWYGGVGPAALAVVLSTVSFYWYFVEPVRTPYIYLSQIPYFTIFVAFALLISWFASVRRRAEKSILEKADLLNLSHDSVFVMDMNGMIKYWNRGAEERYGWSAEEVVGKAVHDLLKTTFPRPLDEINAELIRTGGCEAELVHTRKDGTQIVVASRWALQRDGKGAPVAILETNNDITERKRTDEALRRSEAYLLESQRMTHTGSWVDDGTIHPIYWSEELYRIFGLDPQRGVPTAANALDRIHPDDRDRFLQTFHRIIHQKIDADGEYRIVLPDGTVKILYGIGHPVLDGNGELVEIRGTAADITERKQAEEALRQSEAYLTEAQKLAHTGSWALDLASQKYIYVSAEDFRIWGFDPGDAAPSQEAVFQRIHPEDQERWKKNFENALHDKVDSVDEYRIVLPDGTLKHIHTIRHPVLNEAGDLVMLVGTTVDITERKHAEEAIRQTEKQLRDVFEGIPAMAAAIRQDGSIEFINQRWREYTGMSLEEAMGSGWQSAVHPQDIEAYLEMRGAAIAGGKRYEGEYRVRGASGEFRWFLSRGVPLRNEQGNIVRWYAILTDIDDRKRAEDRLHHENVALREEIDKSSMFEEIVGSSTALRAVLSRVAKVAPSDSTVLITGETGTGKELIARAIHKRSPRSSRAFVSVNCASIPRDLIASELFGHEKGAFTGATQRHLGRFELAGGGTIFLDEVGDLPAETQVALLRVLQEWEFQRVGGDRPIRCNVRVITATNRNLQAAIDSGTFRSDLYYRLNVFPIETPPLRKRREDIPLLVAYFVDRYARKSGKIIRQISKKSLELLQSYPWPGNIRELQNVIERSVIVCESEVFSVDESWLSSQPSAAKPESEVGLSQLLAGEEKQAIEAALRECRGRVSGSTGAAARLGVPRSTLESKIKSLKIEKNRFRTSHGD